MENKKRYTITAALPYANGPLHIGHIAGAYLPADIYVRHLKGKGNDVLFVCGSDEHGAAITLRAKKEGTTPQQIVDEYHTLNKETFANFGIDFSIYHRTSEALHHKTAQSFFSDLNEKGELEIKKSEQYFDEENQQFLADRYITGTCPKCQSENAYGDQCEKCGSTLSPQELINPKSTLSGKPPVLKETKHWYLPMQNHEEWLKKWVETGELNGVKLHDATQWKNHVVGQCKSWIDGGLQPRAMTRDLDWGVKVPVEDADGKVLYVWLDAPIGYISATKQWAADNGKNWEDYWQSKDTNLIHFIGKDNIVFHCVIFPIILKVAGKYVLPKNVPANEFLNLEGNKISTSKNWAVWLHEYLIDFPEKIDELRYVLASIAPENKDSEFTWKDYQARVNNELVAILGNFVNRTIVLTHKYYNGVIPEGKLNGEIQTAAEQSLVNTEKNIEQFKFREALADAMNIARIGNKYLADTEPWKLIKTDEKAVESILYNALIICEKLAKAIAPFLPNTSTNLNNMLGLTEGAAIVSGKTINKASLLFSKVEDSQVEEQVKKLEESKKANQEEQIAEVKPKISFEDFTKLDIRIGTIVEAEKIKKTDKLLQLKVDVGNEIRTIVSGIALSYKPEDIIGQQVSVLLNLEPRKIRGVESHGMILMAENAAEELAFLTTDKPMKSGNTVR